MTRANFLRHVRSVRTARRIVARALSLSLIVIMLATQAPAPPRSFGQMLSESRDNFKFWFYPSGWAKTLRGLTGQSGPPSHGPQEKQSDRDAKVVKISAFPGDVTMRTGQTEFFDALAYDSKGQQVGGVKFTWQAEDLATKNPVKISQTGEFTAQALGTYKVTAEGAGKKAQVTAIVLNAPVQQVPHITVVEEEPPPGWNPSNFLAARDPGNDRGDPPGRPRHHGAGSSNFQITAPVFSLPGRGIDLSLGLIYNSRVWTLSNSDMTYDIDRDWPAAGWSLGFGRVAGLGASGAMLIDADGTRHGFAGTVTQPQFPAFHFEGHTTDGTFIDYSTDTDNTGTINFAQVKYPNGERSLNMRPRAEARYIQSALPTRTATSFLSNIRSVMVFR